MALNGEKTKLVDADITKVDFVPAGAQQHSRISLFKSGDEDSLFNRIIKAVGGVFYTPEEKPNTFQEELAERKEEEIISDIMCEMWDYSYVLHDTIRSIIRSTAPNKTELMQGALDQFNAVVISSISSNIQDNMVVKMGKKISAERMAALKACMKQLAELISSAEEEPAVAHVDGDNMVAQSAETDVKVEEPNNNKPDKAENDEGSEENMAEVQKIAKSVLETLPKEVQEHISSLEAQVAKSAETTPAGSAEDIYKGLPEAVVTILKSQEAQLKTSNEMIAKMRDESIEKEFVAKAATMTDKLGVDAAKFGKVLKSIHAANPELATEVENVIKAANEAVAKGKLFEEVGKESTGNVLTGIAKSDAWKQIETLASGMVTKGESKTQAEAIDAVLKTAEGRKLYEIYTGKIRG